MSVFFGAKSMGLVLQSQYSIVSLKVICKCKIRIIESTNKVQKNCYVVSGMYFHKHTQPRYLGFGTVSPQKVFCVQMIFSRGEKDIKVEFNPKAKESCN